MRLLQKHGDDELDVIMKGFAVVNLEACKLTENHLSKKPSTVADVSLYKSLAKTVMQSKLLREDADVFSTLVGDIWQRNISVATVKNRGNTAADAAYVKLLMFSGMQTAGSKILDGNYLIVCSSSI